MHAEFVRILKCPQCHSGFNDPTRGSSAEDLVLRCPLGHAYLVKDGIPRFVPSSEYADNFGFEWNVHKKTQLDNESQHESEATFRIKTGFTPDELSGRLVLDVGCGMGRFADIASRWGATVVGIDLSTAVEPAYENFGGRENVHIAQADILSLPFGPSTFDYIYSIGVLHHTPNTKASFDKLPALLKPGGKIAIWLYSRYNVASYAVSDLFRKVTPRLSQRWLYRLAHVAIPLGYAYRVPVLGAVARAALPVSPHPKSEWRLLDTFDWYSAKYQWKHTYEEVFPWFEEHGLTDIRVLGYPIGLQGTRPVNPRGNAPPSGPGARLSLT